jgi:DNA-binding GntR family transcriptional regulator
MILEGVLLPGETLRQTELANRLGLSRVPVREALNKLHAEGVVTYKENVGYAVARFDGSELAEIYLMRKLLERELISSMDMKQVNIAYLRELNQAIESLDMEEDLLERERLNREFHTQLFEHSPLKVVRAEVMRLWDQSEFYRALYRYEKDSQKRTVAAHERIVSAIERRDLDLLLRNLDEHRNEAEEILLRQVGHPSSTRRAR